MYARLFVTGTDTATVTIDEVASSPGQMFIVEIDGNRTVVEYWGAMVLVHQFLRPVVREATRCGTVCYDSLCSQAELSCPRTRKHPGFHFPEAGSSRFGWPYCTSSPWPNMPLSTPAVGLPIAPAAVSA